MYLSTSRVDSADTFFNKAKSIDVRTETVFLTTIIFRDRHNMAANVGLVQVHLRIFKVFTTFRQLCSLLWVLNKHTHVRAHTHTPTHTRTYTYTYTHIHTHINTHMHTYTHTHWRIHTNAHTRTHTYTHAHAHKRTHTHAHAMPCIHIYLPIDISNATSMQSFKNRLKTFYFRQAFN